ncbi:uncharacterized protein EV420DRAFT_1731385 [Desarmillaria tabescens]|uniref:Uncharacterized protein n=1 Tax=Armillaria tabescens TaxID=1929756 RepID=A0AA39JCX8_ARMTA|nr:uncharacterized protein EV420DRAFT_1731385 [Desarmillaria tabescens]KAK0440039.1 hypothetical protein EV420DRAFT_1731385 [Desarmillaria tabescens]
MSHSQTQTQFEERNYNLLKRMQINAHANAETSSQGQAIPAGLDLGTICEALEGLRVSYELLDRRYSQEQEIAIETTSRCFLVVTSWDSQVQLSSPSMEGQSMVENESEKTRRRLLDSPAKDARRQLADMEAEIRQEKKPQAKNDEPLHICSDLKKDIIPDLSPVLAETYGRSECRHDCGGSTFKFWHYRTSCFDGNKREHHILNDEQDYELE